MSHAIRFALLKIFLVLFHQWIQPVGERNIIGDHFESTELLLRDIGAGERREKSQTPRFSRRLRLGGGRHGADCENQEDDEGTVKR